MSAEATYSREEREAHYRRAILQEVEEFREKYEPLTPEEVAWSHEVKGWLPRWRAWAETAPIGIAAPIPSLGPSPRATAAAHPIEVSERERLAKHWEWRRLWARAHGLVAMFTRKAPKTTDDDREWVNGVTLDMRALLAERFRELKLVHPEMRGISDIDAAEMVRALFELGEYADDDDEDDDLVSDGLGDDGLDRHEDHDGPYLPS